MTEPVATCIAQRLAKDIAFLAHQGVVSAEEARQMRTQLDPLVGTEYAQPFTSGPPVHQGPFPRAAYPPGLVSTPRAPPRGGYQGPPLGTNVYVGGPSAPTPAPLQPDPHPEPIPEQQVQGEQEELATALYDYKPSAEDELPFVKGDTIVVVAHTTEDWFTGHVQGRVGSDRLFPANYVELRPTKTTSKSPADRAAGTPSSFSYGSCAPPSSTPAYYTPQGYAPQGSGGAYPPLQQQGYPPAQYEAPASAEGDDAKKDKWGKVANSRVGQAAAGGAAWGVGMGIATSIF